MQNNYEKITQANLEKLFSRDTGSLAENLPAEKRKESYIFRAFGETCEISRRGIRLGPGANSSVPALLVSLYALHAGPEQSVLEPFNSYKDFPGSMPYSAAFSSRTEHVLAPAAEAVKRSAGKVKEALDGEDGPYSLGGDFSFLVYPLPKIALCYIFYEADEDFPASATCLFSHNAGLFLPVDALADVGEYTSAKILDIAGF